MILYRKYTYYFSIVNTCIIWKNYGEVKEYLSIRDQRKCKKINSNNLIKKCLFVGKNKNIFVGIIRLIENEENLLTIHLKYSLGNPKK